MRPCAASFAYFFLSHVRSSRREKSTREKEFSFLREVAKKFSGVEIEVIPFHNEVVHRAVQSFSSSAIENLIDFLDKARRICLMSFTLFTLTSLLARLRRRNVLLIIAGKRETRLVHSVL